MEKQIQHWTVQQLRRLFVNINFPEYQREPNIWSRGAKQRLVDSMLRRFDIASLYLYQNDDATLDCIDGRQRINAIMAFLAQNPNDEDNGFEFRILNEIYDDIGHPFASLNGLDFEQIVSLSEHEDDSAAQASNLRDRFLNYEITVVLLEQAERPEEFNLQFTRLNLGTIINAGEKLHAMVGDMRDVCFDDEALGKHPFLEKVSIPTRRYAREQVAAQILAQVFSRRESDQFTRTRHFDLQRFFKKYVDLSDQQRAWINEVTQTFDALDDALADGGTLLRNRAITVTTVLIAWDRKLHAKKPELTQFVQFLQALLTQLSHLRAQLASGQEVEPEHRYLIDFQRHVTQASVERPAVQARFDTMDHAFRHWLRTGKLLEMISSSSSPA